MQLKLISKVSNHFHLASCKLEGYSWTGELGYEKQLGAGPIYTITASVKGEKYQKIRLTVGLPIDGQGRITSC